MGDVKEWENRMRRFRPWLHSSSGLLIGVRPVFRGGRTWMVRPSGEVALGAGDRALLKALLQAHAAITKLHAPRSGARRP